MKKRTCSCGSSNLETHSNGSLICTECGKVFEENQIVNEVNFVSDGGGGNVMLGNFIADDGLNNPLSQVGQRNSRELTLRKAKDAIKHLVAQLRLKDHHTEEAYNYYRLALSKSLTRGRRAEQIYASCVYLSCRTGSTDTEHMLLDFSEVLKINVFVLGKTFIQLTRALNITLPLLDPAFYIYRFAHKLGFASQSKDVIDTANRIVSRMKRDWMAIGRRPSGICGAAFVMAARLHGFKCNIEDITKVVKIGQNTIKKRLHEFGATPSAKLTIDEFLRIDLEDEYDPPSFIRSREELEYKIDENDIEQAEELVPEIERNLDNMAKADERKQARKRKRVRTDTDRTNEDSEHANTEQANVLQSDDRRPETPDSEDPEMKAVREAGFLGENPEAAISRLASQSDSNDQPSTSYDANIESFPEPSTGASLALKMLSSNSSHSLANHNQSGDGGEGSDLDLEGIDDDEIDRMILKPPEVKRKTEMWESRKDNIDWIKRQEDKAQEEKNNPEKAKKMQQKRRRKQHTKTEHGSAGAAMKQVVVAKQKSTRINYANLAQLKEALSTKKKPEPPKLEVKIQNIKNEKKYNDDDDDEDDEDEYELENKEPTDLGMDDIFGGNTSD